MELTFKLPEVLAVLVFGMIIGAAAATAFWVLPQTCTDPPKKKEVKS